MLSALLLLATALPWEGPAFSAKSADMAAAAAAIPAPKDGDVDLLFEDTAIHFDATGGSSYTLHRVFRVLTSRGVNGWSSFEAPWAPWFQDRPELSGRTIDPAGLETRLDPAAISDSPDEDEPETFGDSRVVRAPLPSVAIGSLVEEQIVFRSRQPFFGPGRMSRAWIETAVPIRHLRIVADAAPGVPLGCVGVGTSLKAVRAKSSSGIRWSIDAENLQPRSDYEPFEPIEPADSPHFIFMTGDSWAPFASAYAKVVDEKIGAPSAELDELVHRTVEPGLDRTTAIARLVSLVHSKVRYTGVEFGSAAVVPAVPHDTLARGYGDCKDKAILLVALLRAAGIPAELALLDAGQGDDARDDAPGLESFNHAIVYVPGPPPLWIDATASDAKPGALPLFDLGRHALLIDPKTRGLTMTPLRKAEDDGFDVTETFWLSEAGKSRVDYEATYRGSMDRRARSGLRSAKAELGKQAEQRLSRHLNAARIEGLDWSDPSDLEAPIVVKAAAHEAKRGMTDAREAAVGIDWSLVFDLLPDQLTGATTARKKPFDLPEHYHFVDRIVIHPPPGFAFRKGPPDESTRIGDTFLSAKLDKGDDGTVIERIEFSTGDRPLSPDEVSSLRAAVLAHEKPVPLVMFDEEGALALGSGDIPGALTAFRKLAALHPGEALHHEQMARALLAAGFGDPAREECDRALSLEPMSSTAWKTKGWVLQHDRFGRRFEPGFPQAESVAAYRKAIELDPTDVETLGDLAILLEHDAAGRHFGPSAKLEEAIPLYRKIRDLRGNSDLDANLLVDLLRTGKADEAIRLAPETRASNADAVLVAAYVVRDGVDAGISQAARLAPTESRRSAIADGATALLLGLRRYEDAARILDLVTDSSSGVDKRVRLQMIRRIHRAELNPALANPTDPVAAMMRIGILGSTGNMRLADVLAKDAAPPTAGGSPASAFLGSSAAAIDPAMLGDVLLSLVDFKAERCEGDVCLVHVSGDTPGIPHIDLEVLVTREKKRWRMATLDSPAFRFAQWSSDRIAHSDYAGARKWLSWAPTSDPPDSPWRGTPFAHLWPKEGSSDPETIRLATAAMLPSEMAQRSLDLLGPRPADPAKAVQWVRIRIDALESLGRWDDVLAAAGDFDPKDEKARRSGIWHKVQALRNLHRLDEARAAQEALVAENPRDTDALVRLSYIESQSGAFGDALKTIHAALDVDAKDGDSWNQTAWIELFGPAASPERAAADALESVARDPANESALNTLAIADALAGKLNEAHDAFIRSIGSEVGADDWLAFGLLAERYGLSATAKDAFEHAVAGSSSANADDESVLAREGLERLSRAESR